MTDLAIVKDYYPKPYLTELERQRAPPRQAARVLVLLGRLHACLCS